jgi:hypothetical protein
MKDENLALTAQLICQALQRFEVARAPAVDDEHVEETRVASTQGGIHRPSEEGVGICPARLRAG